jgi:plasmid stabilization system protein ParE
MIKVIWSIRSLNELDEILEYWLKRNKSYSYQNKILRESDNAINLIRIYPNIGIKTDHRNVRMRLILDRFYLVYRINQETIEILKFWDCRQNPKSNKYMK